MVAAILTDPVRRYEIIVDESTEPPTVHQVLPYRDNEKNLWVLRQALLQLKREMNRVPAVSQIGS